MRKNRGGGTATRAPPSREPPPSNATTPATSMGLKIALDLLKLKDSDVANAYVVGSRMWGTSRRDSDWDLVVVVRDESKPAPPAHRDLHCRDVDASVLSASEYSARLRAGHFLEILTARCIPPECIWRETINPRLHLPHDPRAIAHSVIEESDRDWKFAQKMLSEKGEMQRCSRVVASCIRELMIAVALTRGPGGGGGGAAVAVAVAPEEWQNAAGRAKAIRDEACAYSHMGWEEYEMMHREEFDTLRAQLHELL
ncbi:hypothetical protein Pelo_6676 [Pelomyxa schiedti]|nr:hypothetical protein Pelo_6676 [Pelomyxa schiedti]